MQITALEEYGLRCAVQLAREYGKGYLSASQISEQEGISVEYVSKFMHLFKRGGIVVATRGAQGGFSLVDDPSMVTVKAILDALKVQGKEQLVAEGASSSNDGEAKFCSQYTGHQTNCIHLGNCSIRPFWNLMSGYFEYLTQELTLANLLLPESEARLKIESIFRRKFSHVSNPSTFV